MLITDFFVSPEDFESFNWNEIFAKYQEELTCDSLREKINQDLKSTQKDSIDWKALTLLSILSSFMLNGDQNSEEIYLPLFSFKENRGLIPDDLSSSQLLALSSILEDITHIDCHARCADVLWLRRFGDKPFEYGLIAIDFYLKASDELIHTERDQIFTLIRLKRALRLSKQLNSRQNEIKKKIEDYLINRERIEDIVVLELLEMYENNFSDSDIDIVTISRTFSQKLTDNGIFILAERAWRNNAKWNAKMGDSDASREATIKIAELNKKQAIEAEENQNYLVASHFWQQAIFQYRKIEGTQGERENCKERLLGCQSKINENLQSTTFSINLQEIVGMALDRVKDRPFQEAIIVFALSEGPPDVEELRGQVEAHIAEHPLLFIFQRQTLDRYGRTIATSTSDSVFQKDEQFILNEMHSENQLMQGALVMGFVLPILNSISIDHNIETNDLQFLVNNNPLIPPGCEGLILKGLFAGFKKDFIVSSHILVLQVEGIIRYALNQKGVITTSLSDEGIQEEYDINRLLTMPETTEIFGEGIVFDLQGLLINRHGSNLRNRIAHALLTTEDYYSYSSIYLWWSALRLICLPFQQLFLNIVKNDDKNKEE